MWMELWWYFGMLTSAKLCGHEKNFFRFSVPTSSVPNFKPFDRLQQIWQWFTYMSSPSALATMRFHPSPNKLPPLENYFCYIIVTFSVLYMNFFN